jgi:NitT/TauT family transport system substrate-binding protein
MARKMARRFSIPVTKVAIPVIIPVIPVVITLTLLLSGCTTSSVNVVKLSPPDMLEQIKLGKIDAFVAWEPFPSKAVKEGSRIFMKSSDIWPNHPCCVVAYRSGQLNDDVLEALVWAHVKATRFINDAKNKEKIVDYASDFTGLDRETVEIALQNIKYVEYPDEKEFRHYYEFLKESGILKKSVTDIGYGSEDDFFNDFLRKDIYSKVIRKLEENPDYVPEKVGSIRLGFITADLHHLALYVAIKEGYLNKVFEKVETKQFPNGVAIMEAFRLGELDAAYLGGAPATLKRINDDIEIRIVSGVNNEGSAIVVRGDINSPKDLAGKTVAIPGFGTVQDFLMRKVLSEGGLKEK